MKGFRSIIPALTLAGALLAASLPGSVGAQGTRTFSSGFQVQNLSSADATVSIAFYQEGNGTPSATVPGTIDGNGTLTYATLPSAVAAGFRGSAVISSDQQIAAIVNLLSPSLTSLVGGTAGSIGEAYVGVTGGSRSVALPLLFRNTRSGFSTFFSVQNVGQTATNVTVTYKGGNLTGEVSEDPVSIPPGASVRFDQTTSTKLTDDFAGSAIVTSDSSDIAIVVTQVGATTALVYNGFASGSNNPVFPLVNANNGGFITGIALQNIGATATNVTVTYQPSIATYNGGNPCTETLSIDPNGGTSYFALAPFNNGTTATDNCPQGTFVGSASVTANSATMPLVGIVNQLNSRGNKGGSYSSFDAAAASNTIVFPLIQDRVARFFTGFSIVNVGDVDVKVRCTYSGSSVVQESGTLQPGDTFTAGQNNAIAAGFNGSGTCTAVDASNNPIAGAKIVGIANQLRGQTTVDAFFVYEGTNTN